MAAVIYSNSKELDLEVSFYAQQEYLSVQGKRESKPTHKRNYTQLLLLNITIFLSQPSYINNVFGFWFINIWVGFGSSGFPSNKFEEYFRCYPIAMMPDLIRKDDANYGGKIFTAISFKQVNYVTHKVPYVV